MKPQFHFRTLLAVVAVIGCCIGWVVLPEHIARRLVERDYRTPDPSRDGIEWASFRRMIERSPGEVKFSPERRTVWAMLQGNQSFVVTGKQGRYRIYVVHGRLAGPPSFAPMYGGVEFKTDVF